MAVYFRDDKRIEFDPSTFNVDDFYSQAGTAIYDYNRLKKFFELRYHPWKKDPYMIVTPSPLGGQSSLNHFHKVMEMIIIFASFVQQWLSNDDNLGIDKYYKQGVTSPDGDYPSFYKDYYTDTVFPNRINATCFSTEFATA